MQGLPYDDDFRYVRRPELTETRIRHKRSFDVPEFRSLRLKRDHFMTIFDQRSIATAEL